MPFNETWYKIRVSKKMKWAIIFPDNWLGYSPSCINFARMLEKNGHEYLIIHLGGDFLENSQLTLNHFPIIIRGLIPKILNRCGLRKFYKICLFYFKTKQCHKKEHFDRFVGVDDCGYLAAYLIDKQSSYYSLEISKSIYNRFIFYFLNVNLLITQSEERKNYLCRKNINTVYIQNSIISSPRKTRRKLYHGHLIYFGNLIKEHGIEYCIDSLYSLSSETLTMKGFKKIQSEYFDYLQEKYHNLINKKRLFFDFSYIEQDDIVNYLQHYDVGFCLYDYAMLANDYNYISSPSGKMFNYFAAGLPVIANDSIGFAPIKKFDAGITLSRVTPAEIVKAINTINQNYAFFQENSIKASIEYDYANMFECNKDKIMRTN